MRHNYCSGRVQVEEEVEEPHPFKFLIISPKDKGSSGIELGLGGGEGPPHHHHHQPHQTPHPNHHHLLEDHTQHPLPLPSDSFPKRMRLLPPAGERLMIYVRQEGDDIFTPVHLVPPTTLGLLAALEEKFKISMGSVKNLFRRSGKGIVAKVDDEMLKHYCHEDTFTLEVKAPDNEDAFDVTLVEL